MSSSSSSAASKTPSETTTSGSDRRIMNDSTMPPPKVSTTSAKTGLKTTTPDTKNNNPRAKKAVAKGFGLYDWKLLLRKANDLAQRKGAPIRRDITLEEVREHNKVHDGWMILRGKVYNIGPYLHYHPGGMAILKAVLGKDGTQLFDKYHRWVNIEGLIGPLLLGTVQAPVREEEARKIYSDTIIPTKESALNAPRVVAKAAANGSLLLPRPDDNYEEEDDPDEDTLLPPSSSS
jgi:cytochrome b involved in lipid metabolism